MTAATAYPKIIQALRNSIDIYSVCKTAPYSYDMEIFEIKRFEAYQNCEEKEAVLEMLSGEDIYHCDCRIRFNKKTLCFEIRSIGIGKISITDNPTTGEVTSSIRFSPDIMAVIFSGGIMSVNHESPIILSGSGAAQYIKKAYLNRKGRFINPDKERGEWFCISSDINEFYESPRNETSPCVQFSENVRYQIAEGNTISRVSILCDNIRNTLIYHDGSVKGMTEKELHAVTDFMNKYNYDKEDVDTLTRLYTAFYDDRKSIHFIEYKCKETEQKAVYVQTFVNENKRKILEWASDFLNIKTNDALSNEEIEDKINKRTRSQNNEKSKAMFFFRDFADSSLAIVSKACGYGDKFNSEGHFAIELPIRAQNPSLIKHISSQIIRSICFAEESLALGAE